MGRKEDPGRADMVAAVWWRFCDLEIILTRLSGLFSVWVDLFIWSDWTRSIDNLLDTQPWFHNIIIIFNCPTLSRAYHLYGPFRSLLPKLALLKLTNKKARKL